MADVDHGFKIVVHRFPMIDTGTGAGLGYADDAALLAAVEEERGGLDAEVLEALAQADTEAVRAFIYGEAAPALHKSEGPR